MAFIDWHDKYSVKVTSMDEQHKNLVKIINELHEYQKQGRSKEVMEKTLMSLVEYTKTHFQAEEKIMQNANYPKLAEHKKSHQKLLNSVSEYVTKFQSGESITAIQLLNFLQNWLLKHIANEDMEYGKHINQNEKVTAIV